MAFGVFSCYNTYIVGSSFIRRYECVIDECPIRSLVSITSSSLPSSATWLILFYILYCLWKSPINVTPIEMASISRFLLQATVIAKSAINVSFIFSFLPNPGLSSSYIIALDFSIFSSVLTFIMSCVCHILQTLIPRHVSQKFKLSLFDFTFQCPCSSHVHFMLFL